MELTILTLIYLIASVTFILGLKMLSHPETARKGNLIAAAGMGMAIFGTIFLYKDLDTGERLHNYGWIFAGLIVGGIIGTLIARRVKMTAMPEMVSLFNGMGGACAALISIAEFNKAFQNRHEKDHEEYHIDLFKSQDRIFQGRQLPGLYEITRRSPPGHINFKNSCH